LPRDFRIVLQLLGPSGIRGGNRRRKGCGKGAEGKCTNHFSLPLGIAENPAAIPLSHSHGGHGASLHPEQVQNQTAGANSWPDQERGQVTLRQAIFGFRHAEHLGSQCL